MQPRGNTKAAKAKVSAARTVAKDKAKEIVATAKERAAGIVAKQSAKSTAKPASSASQTTSQPREPERTAAPPSPQSQRLRIVAGYRAGADGHMAFDAMAQTAARNVARAQVAQHGVVPREPHAAGKDTLEVKDLGDAHGMFDPTTHAVQVSPEAANRLAAYHTEDPRALGSRVNQGDREALANVLAQHAIVHEQLHASGPDSRYEGHGVFADEMATEMAARAVTAATHGISQGALVHDGGYADMMTPAVQHLATASGKTFGEAHEALASAALAYKRGELTQGVPFKTEINGDYIIHAVTKQALGNLGQHNADAHHKVYKSFVNLASQM